MVKKIFINTFSRIGIYICIYRAKGFVPKVTFSRMHVVVLTFDVYLHTFCWPKKAIMELIKNAGATLEIQVINPKSHAHGVFENSCMHF